MTQDNELIFSFPAAMLEEMVTNLESQTKKGYLRIPVVPYVTFGPQLVPPYAKLDKKLKAIE
jgi:hypothetical protein